MLRGLIMKRLLGEERRLFAWMPVILWASIILFFSVLPARKIPLITVQYLDKAFHFFEFAILAFLMMRSLYRDIKHPLRENHVLFTLISGSAYGIVLELIQRFVPGRDMAAGDVVANIAGIVLGILLGKIIVWQK
jgi:VanZ family protein